MHEYVYAPGEIIYKEDDKSKRLYIIFKGSVELYIQKDTENNVLI